MADKAKFAFGSLAGLQAAIDAGKVDAFDLLCLVDDGVPRIGWMNKNSEPVIIDVPEEEVVAVDALPETGEAGVVYIVGDAVYIWNGSEFVAISQTTDLSAIMEQMSALETELAEKADADAVSEQIGQVAVDARAYTDEQIEYILDDYVVKKYEVSHKPEGTLVNYRNKEIRVMCPANTVWSLQQSGEGADENAYYIGFKAYAPESAVSFKEDLAEIITDAEMYYFEGNDFAGVEEDGRKYSIVWLPVAKYDTATSTWTYYGAASTVEKYIGWYYSVEWYNEAGVVVASDCIRINLSNEECHSSILPFYMNDIKKELKAYTDEQIETKVEEVSEIPVVEF